MKQICKNCKYVTSTRKMKLTKTSIICNSKRSTYYCCYRKKKAIIDGIELKIPREKVTTTHTCSKFKPEYPEIIKKKENIWKD